MAQWWELIEATSNLIEDLDYEPAEHDGDPPTYGERLEDGFRLLGVEDI